MIGSHEVAPYRRLAMRALCTDGGSGSGSKGWAHSCCGCNDAGLLVRAWRREPLAGHEAEALSVARGAPSPYDDAYPLAAWQPTATLCSSAGTTRWQRPRP